MKENARREAIRANQRAKSARADAAKVRARFERLTTMRAVDEWTKINGFVPSYLRVPSKSVPQVPQRKQWVARRDTGLKIDVLVAKVEHEQQAN